MALIFDLESLARYGGVDAIQHRQRDFSPYLIHFTSYSAMEPIREFVDDLKQPSKRGSSLSSLRNRLTRADRESRDRLIEILRSKAIAPRQFDPSGDYKPAVCLTECTLAGVLSHSERYGRYGLVFRKDLVYRLGGRPVAYVDSEARPKIAVELNRTSDLASYNLFLNNLNPPRQSGGTTQDYTHEREWRCPVRLEVRHAEALVVASVSDYNSVEPFLDGRPFLPLDFLYRLGV